MADELAQNRCFCPKHAYTLFFSVTRSGDVGADGRIWSFRTREPLLFHGLDGFFRELDILLAEPERSGSGMEHEHLYARTMDPAVRTEPSACRTPSSDIRREPEAVRGKSRMGAICVASRQDDSMRGEARFFDRERSRIPFRGALELRQILREWLMPGPEADRENPAQEENTMG